MSYKIESVQRSMVQVTLTPTTPINLSEIVAFEILAGTDVYISDNGNTIDPDTEAITTKSGQTYTFGPWTIGKYNVFFNPCYIQAAGEVTLLLYLVGTTKNNPY